MQSSVQMKDFYEYGIGHDVMDGDFVIGQIVAMTVDPQRSSIGYMLIINSKREWTIYWCVTNAKSHLSLKSHIPEFVMREFAEIILGGKPAESAEPTELKPYKSPVKKKDVPENIPVEIQQDRLESVESLIEPTTEVIPLDESVEEKVDNCEIGAPYFDFV